MRELQLSCVEFQTHTPSLKTTDRNCTNVRAIKSTKANTFTSTFDLHFR